MFTFKEAKITAMFRLCMIGIAAIFFPLLFLALPAIAKTSTPKKIALLIGIGPYLPGNSWKTLHGDHDADLLKHALLNAGLKEANIRLLKNENATKAAILAAFKNLYDSIAPGDIVILHFSGHGQQVTDISGDEADGLDEALVPYDAPATESNLHGIAYDGEKHLTDDELAVWFQRFRTRLGATGQLVVFVDACHSGTLSRGNGILRGEAPPFLFATAHKPRPSVQEPEQGLGYLDHRMRKEANQAKFVMVSAARADEQNYEHPTLNVGSLSYALANAFETGLTSSESSYRDLFEHVRNTMAAIAPSQNPELEGDKEAKIFGNGLVVQQPFYRINGYNKDGMLEIGGGRLFGLLPGAVIGLFPIGTRTTDGHTPMVTGEIAKAEDLRSFVILGKTLPPDKLANLRAYVLRPVFEHNKAKVFIDNIPAEITARLRRELSVKRIAITDEAGKAMLLVNGNGNLLEIRKAVDGSLLVHPVDPAKEVAVNSCGADETELVDPVIFLAQTIRNYVRNAVVKNAHFSDRRYGLKIRIIPAKTNPQANKTILLAKQNNLPSFNTKNSQAVLEVQNTGLRPGYVYLLELDPTGKLCPLLGFDQEIRLQPGAKNKTVVEGFVPPAGRYLIKGYITEEPIGNELSWFISGQDSKARSSRHYLVSVLAGLLDDPGTSRTGNNLASGGVSAADCSYDLVN